MGRQVRPKGRERQKQNQPVFQNLPAAHIFFYNVRMFRGGPPSVLRTFRKALSLIGRHSERHINRGGIRPVITPEEMLVIRTDSVTCPKPRLS